MNDKIENSKIPNLKSKEELFNLLNELKNEINGNKLEIDENELEEKIKSLTMSQLINYIHDSIQILLKKKIQDAKDEQREEDIIENNKNIKPIKLNKSEIKQYENNLKKLEFKERKLTKMHFQYKLQREAMENKIGEYMEMEEEFDEMKIKLKYEDGKFLNNDRKDNEINILKQENVNLKNAIKENDEKNKLLEINLTKKENEISYLKNSIEELKIKLEEKQKELSLFSNINININSVNSMGINNNTNVNNKYSFHYSNNNSATNLLSSGTKDEINSSSLRNENSPGMKVFHFQKIKSNLIKKKKKNNEFLSNTRNELAERTKLDLISKYFTNQNKNNNNSTLNNSCIKITRLPPSNINNNINILNNNNSNNNIINNNIPILKNNIQQNQIFSYSHKSGSTTRKPSNRTIISYKAISGD